MINKSSIYIILTILSVGNIFGQKTREELNGDKHYYNFSFDNAIDSYNESDSLTIEGKRKLAQSYINIDSANVAEAIYEKIIASNAVNAEDYYSYVATLRKNGKYEEAGKWMQTFKQLKPDDLRAKNYAENNSQLSNMLKDDGKYKIGNLAINTNQQDFGPSFFLNKIVFTSSRTENAAVIRNYNWNRKPFLDLYVSEKTEEQLAEPKLFNKAIEKKLHEGPATFSNEGTFMAFTRNNYSNKANDGSVKLEIFFSVFTDGKWQEAFPFKLNNPDYSVGHPCLNSDGSTMYFVSDTPGGFGGADIYVINKDSTGNWGTPYNLGNKVNTEGSEMFPYFEENNGFLFFASNGHMGLGGLDVFVATVKENGIGNVFNMGFPLNTQGDDFALIIDEKMRNGFFSSNRRGGKGDDDIYSLELLAPLDFGKNIKGKVLDKQGKLLAGYSIKLIDEEGKEVENKITAEDGLYSFEAKSNKNYKLKGSKPAYFEKDIDVNTAVSEEYISKDFIVEKIPTLALTGIITEKSSEKLIGAVSVRLINNVTGKIDLDTLSTETGAFSLKLKNNFINDSISYDVVLEKDGYNPRIIEFNKLLLEDGEFKINQQIDLTMEKTFVTEVVTKPLISKAINGVIRDRNGNPLQSVMITLFDEYNQKISSIPSSDQGTYSFYLDPNKNYFIRAEKETYYINEKLYNSNGSSTLDNVDFVLDKSPGFTFTALITDAENNKFLEGTNLKFFNNKTGKEEFNVLTSSNGKCQKTLDNKLNDSISYNIKIEKEGYKSKIVEFNKVLLSEGFCNLNQVADLSLKKINNEIKNTEPQLLDKTIKGVVRDKTGNVLVNSVVKLSESSGRVISELYSDSNGYFAFIVGANNNLIVTATKKGFSTEEMIVHTNVSKKLYDCNFTLSNANGFSVVGHISEKGTNKLLKGVKVKLIDNKTGKEEVLPLTTLNGNFKKSLPEKKLHDSISYSLVLEKSGYYTKIISFNKTLETKGILDINSFADLELTKEEPAQQKISELKYNKIIKGIAKDDHGLALAGAKILLTDDSGVEYASTLTRDDGTYSFAAAVNKKYTIIGTKDKYYDGLNKVYTFHSKEIGNKDLTLKKEKGFRLLGIVTEKGTNKKLGGVKVALVNRKTGIEELSFQTATGGGFEKILSESRLNDTISYNISLSKDGYLSKIVTYTDYLKGEGIYKVNKSIDLSLGKVVIGKDNSKLIDLNPIYFDFDKSVIKKEAAIELEKIVKVMNENPTMVVELSSYTDCRGAAKYNQKLSERRAKATAKYVRKKITNPSRFDGKGYGENNLKNDCNCEASQECPSEQHQLNRRSEFVILRMY